MTPEPPPPAVVVTAPRLPDAVGDAAFSVVSVGRDALAGAATLDEALKSVAGFSLYRRTSTLGANPTTQGVGLRAIAGSGASRALVTLDGVPVNDPFGGWVIWSALPPASIGAARIVRGAGAGPYGAGALTGVVSLTSRDDLEGLEGEGSVGSLGYRQGAGAAGGAVGTGRYRIDLSGQGSDGWIPVRQGRGVVDRPLTLSAGSGAVRVTQAVGAATIAARVAAYDEDRGAGVLYASSRAKGVQASLTAARQPAGEAWGWQAQLWAFGSDLYNATATVAPGRASATPANVQYATPALGWGAKAMVRRTGEVNLEFGADVRAATGESRERFGFTGGDFTKARKAGGQTLVGGVYAEANGFLAGWLITGGARLDRWSQSAGERVESVIATGAVTLNNRPAANDGTLPTAGLAARRELGGGFAWRSAAYAGFRPATLNELHRPFRVGANVTEANPALTPERLLGVEMGLDYAAGPVRASATLFRNRLDDAITNVTVGAGPATYPIAGFIPAGGGLRMRQNAGAVDARGLEADGEVRLGALLGGALSLTGSVAWTHSTVDGSAAAPQLDGKRPALTPRFTGVAGLRWEGGRWSLALDGRYESARFDDDLNTLRLAPAFTTDARLEWRVRPGWAVYLAADNLLNREVRTAEAADGTYSYDAPWIVRVGIRVRG